MEVCVGEIQNSCDQICIQWDIKEYFSVVPQKVDTSVTSPYFQFANNTWYLEIFPNGSKANNTLGWINLYLCVKGLREEKLINYTISFKCHDKHLNELSADSLFKRLNDSWGFTKFIGRNELLQKKHDLVPQGTLTIVCRARCLSQVKEVASEAKHSLSISSLSEDLRNLLIDEKNSDVVIKVKGKIFRVHKLILGSRSSVFSAMFGHDMKENATGTVNIDDVEPEIFHDFLLFLYSGKLEKLSLENVIGLYTLADKYDLEDLMSICLDFIKKNLDLSNVCIAMAIADRHHEEELKKSASQIIKRNLKTLIPSSQWITFMAENPTLAAELLMEFLPDNKS